MLIRQRVPGATGELDTDARGILAAAYQIVQPAAIRQRWYSPVTA